VLLLQRPWQNWRLSTSMAWEQRKLTMLTRMEPRRNVSCGLVPVSMSASRNGMIPQLQRASKLETSKTCSTTCTKLSLMGIPTVLWTGGSTTTMQLTASPSRAQRSLHSSIHKSRFTHVVPIQCGAPACLQCGTRLAWASRWIPALVSPTTAAAWRLRVFSERREHSTQLAP
jgi:hypothetical protein